MKPCILVKHTGEIKLLAIHYRKILLLSLLSGLVVSCAHQESSVYRDDNIYAALDAEPELMQIVLKKKNNELSDKEVPVWRAIGFLGTPYKFGANTDEQIDCSAFIQRIFKDIKSLERTSYGQFLQLRRNAKLKPEKGDLVFFKTSNYNPVTYVGIMFSPTKFIHASTSQGVVSVGDLNQKYWRKNPQCQVI